MPASALDSSGRAGPAPESQRCRHRIHRIARERALWCPARVSQLAGISFPASLVEPGQEGSVRAASITRRGYCADRAGALDCAQSKSSTLRLSHDAVGEIGVGFCALFPANAARFAQLVHPRDTKSPRGRNAPRAPLTASAPIRIRCYRPRRSPNPLPLRISLLPVRVNGHFA